MGHIVLAITVDFQISSMASPKFSSGLSKRHIELCLTTALVAAGSVFYSTRGGHAGYCYPTGNPTPAITHTCIMPIAPGDSTQTINTGAALRIETSPGFGIASNGNAFSIVSNGGLIFRDFNNSTITGDDTAIATFNSGSGDVEITTTGNVTGIDTSYDGINAVNYNTAGDLTIRTDGNVVGGSSAIQATNNGPVGSGDLTITTNGNVTGGSDGINANNYVTSGDLTIDVNGNANTVTGGIRGIRATSTRAGGISINTEATVTATTASGIAISAFNGATGSFIDIVTSGTVTSSRTAIDAYNLGTGDLTITSSGTVQSTATVGSYNGINARQQNAAGGVVTIRAENVSSGTQNGIYARQQSSNATLTVETTGTVSGGTNGIYTRNDGTGNTNITVSGAVSGGGGGGDAGIRLSNYGSGTNTITLNNGALVSATSGDAILDGNVETNIIVNNGATIIGDLDLGGGDDTLTFNAGSVLNQLGTLNGGGGGLQTDTITFNAVTGTVASTTSIFDFEIFTVDNGSTLFRDTGGTPFTITGSGTATLNITGGSTFEVSDGFQTTSSGTLNMSDGIAGDQLIVNGAFSGTPGTINLDVDFATDTSDVITVQDVATTAPLVLTLNGVNNASANGGSILLVDITGGAPSTQAVELTVGGLATSATQLVANGITYDLQQDANNDWILFAPTLASTIYNAYASGLLDQAKLMRFHDRVNARYHDTLDGNTERRFAIWAQLEGGAVTNDESASDGAGVGYDLTTGRLEAGFDTLIAQTAHGLITAGLNASIGQSTLSAFDSDSDEGEVGSDIFTLGATLTYSGKNGFYADGQLKHYWFDSTIDAPGGTELADEAASAIVTGLEIGQSVAVTDAVTLVPQAQLTYTYLAMDGFTDSNNADVTFDGADSLKMRLGLAAETALGAPALGGLIRVSGDITHEFLDGVSGAVSGVGFEREGTDWTGTLGLDLAFGDSTNGFSVRGGVDVSADLEDMGDSTGITGQLGVRLKL